MQILTPEQLDSFDSNPLDATKVWTDIPEVKVGTMTWDRYPANVFHETEQAAFAPANLVPGIEPSEDRLLQGRMFSYADAQLYRVGTNVNQLPINAPRVPINGNDQDGALNPVRCACNCCAKGMHEAAFCDRPHFFSVIRSAVICQYS